MHSMVHMYFMLPSPKAFPMTILKEKKERKKSTLYQCRKWIIFHYELDDKLNYPCPAVNWPQDKRVSNCSSFSSVLTVVLRSCACVCACVRDGGGHAISTEKHRPLVAEIGLCTFQAPVCWTVQPSPLYRCRPSCVVDSAAAVVVAAAAAVVAVAVVASYSHLKNRNKTTVKRY